MYNFNRKQKIILGILLAIVVAFISYYVYARENNTNIELESNLEIVKEETKEENDNEDEDRILVHVSGAVNQESIVELKPESRIADAIEKARRSKRRC